MPARSLLLMLSLLVVFLVGCGGSPALVPVTGTVHYRGQPISGGVIVFTPNQDRGNRGKLAMAEVRADGSFTLTTEGRPGCKVGWHRVTVASPDSSLPDHFRDPDLSGQHIEVKGKSNRPYEVVLQ